MMGSGGDQTIFCMSSPWTADQPFWPVDSIGPALPGKLIVPGDEDRQVPLSAKLHQSLRPCVPVRLFIVAQHDSRTARQRLDDDFFLSLQPRIRQEPQARQA